MEKGTAMGDVPSCGRNRSWSFVVAVLWGLWTGSVGRLPLLGSELYDKADTDCSAGEAAYREWWPSGLGGVQWWLGAVWGSAGEDFCEVSSEGRRGQWPY